MSITPNHGDYSDRFSRNGGFMKYIVAVVLVFISFSPAKGHIRINQVGYLADEPKRAVVGTNQNLQGQTFSIRNVSNGQVAYSGSIGSSISGVDADTPFAFNYIVDFTPVTFRSSYRIELQNGETSFTFRVGNDVYRNVIDTLLYFLKAQRCGNTQPELHTPCHLADATNTDLDLAGGWHDAGDFIKFTKQEAYTTYILLLSYEILRGNYGPFFSDQIGNGIADVLDEAKTGLDFLEKCYPDENTFIHRVGNMEADHSQPFRIPENDRLAETNRPALFGFKRDPLAKYAYTMALASGIFRDTTDYASKSQTYLALAKRAYAKAKSIGSGHKDKLCLAAVELYRTTNDDLYLAEAKKFNDQIYTSDMGNYFNNTNLAHARLAPFYPRATTKLRQSVKNFYHVSLNKLFGFPVQYVWGSLYVALSSGTAGWHYQIVTSDQSFSELQCRIRDYTLGMNPWGVCFISGLGSVYPKNIHNSVALILKRKKTLKEGTIKGAVAEGPYSRVEWEKDYRRFVPEKEDIYAEFQTSECVYHDHLNDYVTNEPCIYGTAEAILFFSFYLKYLNSTNLEIPNSPQNTNFVR